MKLLICIIYVGFLISCRQNKGESVSDETKVEDDGAVDSEVLKADVVIAIEPKIPSAIQENWSRNRWIREFGQPFSEREINGGKVLEYIQPGPYPPSGKKLITGVIVFLQNDKTVDTELHVTTFGVTK